MAVSFPGGKRLRTYKNLTIGAPVRRISACPTLYFPLSQGLTAPLTPLVQIGDRVRAGQKIADLEDYLAVPVHSSVSGIVTDITDVITIENDGLCYEAQPRTGADPSVYTTRELLWLIRDAGIVEPDGEPAHIKLNPHKSIRFLIANCAESDLYVASKQRLIENHAAEIAEGLKIAMRILNLRESYIGVEAHMKGCFNSLKKAIRYNTAIRLLKLKSKYPQSDETQMIKAVTGLDTPVGSVVVDALTLYNIARAVNHGKSVTERIVTVSGNAVKTPSDFTVPIGASVSFLLNEAGGVVDEGAKIVRGGGIKGIECGKNAYVTKNTDAILALSEQKSDNPLKSCALCGKCVRSCPMRINPRFLSSANDIERLENNFILECSECGLCSYVCPKRRNPMKRITDKKALIVEKTDRI